MFGDEFWQGLVDARSDVCVRQGGVYGLSESMLLIDFVVDWGFFPQSQRFIMDLYFRFSFVVAGEPCVQYVLHAV